MKLDEIPAHPRRLYVKLYCEKKGVKDKKTIAEAKKSWNNLSQKKKTHFYKTTVNRNVLNNAHSLSQTKIYLKEKTPKNKKGLDEQQSVDREGEVATSNATAVSTEDVTETALHQPMECDSSFHFIENKPHNTTELEDPHQTQSHVDSDDASTVIIQLRETKPTTIDNTTELDDSHQTQNHVDSDDASTVIIQLNETTPSTIENNTALIETHDTQSNADTDNASNVEIRLSEPTPPTVMLGKDLYEAIRKPGDISWKEITRIERAEYNTAVRVMKRDYLKKYVLYLESLSRQKFYEHYMKTLY